MAPSETEGSYRLVLSQSTSINRSYNMSSTNKTILAKENTVAQEVYFGVKTPI